MRSKKTLNKNKEDGCRGKSTKKRTTKLKKEGNNYTTSRKGCMKNIQKSGKHEQKLIMP